MDPVLWMFGYILTWTSFISSVMSMKAQKWRHNLESRLLKLGMYRRLAEVTVELHATTRNTYVRIEKLAMQNATLASIWDDHLKYPLNSALGTLKFFSQWLQARAQIKSQTDTDLMQFILDATTNKRSMDANSGAQYPSNCNPKVYSGLSRELSCGIRDLSHEVQLLGDFPTARTAFYTIWLGQLASDRSRVAVKLFTPDSTTDTQRQLFREARIWSRVMRHENVMPLLGVARLQNSLALVSPWMPDGNLKTYLEVHPEVNRMVLLADIACALAYIHSQGVVYTNLRLSTVLVSSMGRAYLSSFLLAYSLEEDELGPSNLFDWQFVLDWRFVSPELLDREDKTYKSKERLIGTTESDVFAFANLAMMTFTSNESTALYKSQVIKNLLERKLPDRPRFLAERGLTDDLWILMNACWHREPKQRPTMAEVARRMVDFAEVFNPPSNGIRPTPTRPVLRDISAEIKKLSEHPVAGGGCCDLYLGERFGSEKVALKLVRLLGSTEQDKDAARRHLLSEASLWARLRHARILEFYGICEYGTMSIFMVSPFLENGNVMHYLSNINPDADRYRLLSEAAEGLLYLHQYNPPVVHGDLKGANILIADEGAAVLADFGLSRISHEATATMLQGAGSPRWMAPELILAEDDVTGPLKTPKSDVYAYGHVILEVLSNKKPFYNIREDMHVIIEVLHGRRSRRPDGSIAEKWLTDSIWKVSRQCTAIDAEKRPVIEDIAAWLQHFNQEVNSGSQTQNGHVRG